MANVTAPAPGSISSPTRTDPTLDVSLISTPSSSSTSPSPSPPATATESSLTPPPVSSPPPPEPSASPPPPPPPEPSTSPPPPPPDPSASPPPPPPPPEPSASPPPPSEPSESPPPPDKPSKSPPTPDDQPSLSSSPPPPDSVSTSPPENDQGASPGSGPPSPSTIPVTPSPPDQPTNSAFSEQTPPSPVTSLPSPSNNKSPSSSSSLSSHPNRSSVPPSSNSENTGLIMALTFTCIIILAMAIIGAICCLRRKKRTSYYPAHPGGNYNGVNTMMGTPPAGGYTSSSHLDSVNGYSSDFSGGAQHTPVPMSPNMNLGVNKFSYEELAAATGGFSQGNVIGQGGFGFVHKGILPNGKEVAVKSLKAGSGQGEREFQAEVDIISRVHHRHLVSLVGYCIDRGQRILVYEFVPNKTLEYHLHDNNRSGQAPMSWGTRLKIALGSAKGLAYLHEDCHPRIIHRDIKTANILIDYNFEAMVADFGLAKLSADNNTHVSTRVMGTFGYLAPEYASSGKLSEKSDVFSFGVMLLELITGRRPLDQTGQIMEDTLVDWARPLLGKAQETGNYDELADPLMEGNYNHNEMSHMVACASASISHSARRRPKMSQIVRSLEGDLSIEALNDSNSKPGQGDSSAYDTGAYNADMTKFRQMVMSSQDFNSSEYSDTSEYRLNPSQTSSSES